MKKNLKVLIPTPSYGFDPTEASIPWKFLKENDVTIEIATPDGKPSNADKLMVTGEKLGIFKSSLAAKQGAVDAYHEFIQSPEFTNPKRYEELKSEDYDGIILPGGHDKAIKEYLESSVLQSLIAEFFADNKPVGAVCHGVVLVARSIDQKTGESVIYDYDTTCLLKTQENLAYNMTRLWLKDYYLTYPETRVEEQVKSVLKDPNQLKHGPLPLFRDSEKNINKGFVVRDRNYLSARWPGDIHRFSHEFLLMLNCV